MDTLPDQLVCEILSRIEKTIDRNSLSLVCRRFLILENAERRGIRVGCGLDPVNLALTTLCSRFPNLVKLEINYSGWMSIQGKQLDDGGLHLLSTYSPSLKDLSLNYCSFITDAGLSSLASCISLSALKLTFTPRITGCGVLSVVVNCKRLTLLHLVRCMNVRSVEWLEYLGKLQTIQDLYIKNCRAIGEEHLLKLGSSWQTIKRLHFEVDTNQTKFYVQTGRWQKQLITCENLLELSLVCCIIQPGVGLACILDKCKNLEKFNLDMCVGVKDDDIVGLARKSTKLRSISLRVPSSFVLSSLFVDNSSSITDESLKALAQNCLQLESVVICISDGEFTSVSPFTLEGILCLIQMCPLRELTLDHVCFFNNVGMESLCSAAYLQTLNLTRCQEISDDGLKFIEKIPQLRVLRLCKCLGVTSEGLMPLVGSQKLEELGVYDCPQISERGVRGAAKSVIFKQDLSWMY